MMPLLALAAHAQGGTITADPNAQQLRLIWKVTGKPFVGGDKVGAGAGGLGDIYGTGKGAWAVYYGTALQWRIYRNDSDDIAKDTVPVQVFDSLGAVPSHPILGDFWGTGHRAIGFPSGSVEIVDDRYKYYYELYLFRTESNRIADSPSVVLNTKFMNPPRQVSAPNVVLTTDLNGDGADELILVHGGVGYDTGVSNYPELWIYKGGPDFQLDSPTVIVKHPLMNGQVSVSARTGDFDGDGHLDIAVARSHTDTRNHLTFYWGTGRLNDFGLPENTRIIALTDSMPDARSAITALDCDGDGITDLAFERGRGQPSRQGIYLFRSSGRVGYARNREYTMSSADAWFRAYTAHRIGGHLNDSLRRCDMLMVFQSGFNPGDPTTMYALSGGPEGPDSTYEAYATSSAINLTQPLFDADGDGWDDFIVANYSVDFEGGIAAIFAGGPYIPSPKRSGVEAVAGEGHMQAVTVWPNPARDELHIAWRGDLKHMPSGFSVHDVLGRIVASGDVDSWRGTALWQCEDVASGIYLLSIYDINNTLIATTRIIKQ